MKHYRKKEVLDSPTEGSFLYLVETQDKLKQYYMYELPPNDPLQEYLRFMEKISHPNILQVVEKLVTEESTFYVTEVPQPTLLKHQSLLTNRHFYSEYAHVIFGQLLTGLMEVHRLGYLYLNCKPDSIKYEDSQAKLSSFYNLLKASKAAKLREGLKDHLHQRFVPPEDFIGQPLTIKTDFWMLGVTYYFMLNGEYPFPAESTFEAIKSKCEKGFDYKESIENGKSHNLSSATPENCEFFRKVFVIDAYQRISERDIKTFAHISKYFSEQTLSYINYEKVEESVIRSRIDKPDEFMRYLDLTINVLDFLYKNAAYAFTDTAYLLSESERLTLRYALLKVALVNYSELNDVLDSKEVDHYRLNKEFVLVKEHLVKLKKILDMQFKQITQELENDKAETKSAKQLLGELYQLTVPQGFIVIKKPFRNITSKLFSTQSKLFSKSKDPKDSRQRLELLVRIVFYHLINRIFEGDERDDNLRIYYKWNHDRKDISGLGLWIAQDKDENLTRFVKYISEKYL